MAVARAFVTRASVLALVSVRRERGIELETEVGRSALESEDNAAAEVIASGVLAEDRTVGAAACEDMP